MSKLKKLLALVLAVAMVLSVSAFAGYDYADADKIDEACVESVSLMYGLNIMKGDGKNFNPESTITRAEMAKMIYVVLNYGKDDLAVNYKGAKMFDDVATGSWYEGYVNYCAITNLVQGVGANKFDPEGTLTTAAAAKMLLTAIGYDAHARGYVGADWDKQVLADAAVLGLLDGYNYPTNTAAPRQWVAVMFKNALLNALTYDTITPVIFNGLLTGNTLPTSNYKTMGEKYFDLVEFEGVITANEYADLYGEEPLDAGETQIGDKVYNLSTDLDEIGENRWGYAVGADVMYIKDTGNHTWDNDGVATTVKASKVDMDSLKDAEYFVNFGADVEGYYVSDYKITYVIEEIVDVFSGKDATAAKKAFKEYYGIDADDATRLADGDYVVTYTNASGLKISIRPDAKIVDTDLNCIKEIFYSADLTDDGDTIVVGEVYVGTQSLEDVSDELSYRAFYNKYIDDQADYTDSFDEAVNGEWLKVIDNDDDGTAEYVFLLTTDMCEIKEISKKASRYTFTTKGGTFTIKSSVIVTEDELAEGDIVLVTLIDGVYYVDLAEVKTETIDKRGIDFKKETLTCGENTYSWSGINEYTDITYDDIDELYAGDEYDMYFDRFGFVRVAEYPAFNRGFVLLTDGYFETNKRDEIWMAEIFNTELDEFEDVNVLYGSSYNEEMFINSDTTNGDKEWDRLKEFGAGYVTNLAAYAINDDGDYALYDVEGKKVNGTAGYYDVIGINPIKTNGKAISVSTKELTDVEGNDVHVTTKTQYYLVTKNSKNVIKSVTEWVGYNNAPDGTALNPVGLKAYAITHEAEKMPETVADVVVFESQAAITDNLGLVFALAQIRNDYAVDSYEAYEADYLGYDSENEVYANLTADLDPDYGDIEIDELDELLQYALIDSDGNLYVVGEDYADYYIYAGVAADDAEVISDDYVYIDEASGEEYDFIPEDVQNFIVVENSATSSVSRRYDIVENEEGYEYGDKLIFVTKSNGTVLYVINVDESYDDETYDSWDKDTYGVDALTELFWDIWNDARKAPAAENTLYSVKVLGEKVEATKADPFTYVAYVCEDEATGTAPRLEVVDNYAGAEMELWNKDKTAKIGEETGIGSIADNGDTVSALTEWIVVSDGVEYTVKVVILNHETALTSADDTKANVTYDVIQIASTYANENSLTENALNAVLNVPATAELDFDADDFTVIVEAECGHVAEYVVAFVEYPFSAGMVASADALSAALAEAEDGETIQLFANIELTEAWTPMGTEEEPFSGTFDGNGHTIYGLEIDEDEAGFFGYVADDATIKDITFEDVDVNGKYAAAVAYYAGEATIENVQVSGSVNATSYAAGIVFEGSGTVIKDCVNNATIDAGYSGSGIGGWIVGGATVDGCENNGDVTGGNRAGGICGNFDGTMTDCVNGGDVVSTGSGAAGGMIGIASAATTIENCINDGDVTTTADNANASAAGILGQNPGSKAITITSCVNNGDITAEHSHAAGIAVSLYGKITADGCSNTGTIYGEDGAADIVAPKGIFGGTNTVK